MHASAPAGTLRHPYTAQDISADAAGSRGTPAAATAQRLNAQVSDDLLCQRVSDHVGPLQSDVQNGPAAGKPAEGFVDLEQGGKGCASNDSSDSGKETVDFLGGFSVHSTFDPDKDV